MTMSGRSDKGAELVALKLLIDEHERVNDLPQRGYLFADSPSGTDAGRIWRFGQGRTYDTIDQALAAQRELAREYGIGA